MKQMTNLDKLKTAPWFTLETLGSLYQGKKASLCSNVKRWLKRGYLVRLKKGFYTTKAYLDSLDPVSKGGYKEFMSNALVPESYLSLEYVLQRYALISESVNAYTSVTVKSTKTINNKLGRYLYSSVSPKIFTGYSVVNREGFTVVEATKIKALFDYLYLRTIKSNNMTLDKLLSFRLNVDELTKEELKEFTGYCGLLKQRKFNVLAGLLKEASKL